MRRIPLLGAARLLDLGIGVGGNVVVQKPVTGRIEAKDRPMPGGPSLAGLCPVMTHGDGARRQLVNLVQRSGDHNVQIKAQDGPVQIRHQTRSEQGHLAHRPLPVGHGQRRVHGAGKGLDRQFQNLDFRVQPLGALCHAQEPHWPRKVAPHTGVQAVDILGTKGRAPFDAHDVDRLHGARVATCLALRKPPFPRLSPATDYMKTGDIAQPVKGQGHANAP